MSPSRFAAFTVVCLVVAATARANDRNFELSLTAGGTRLAIDDDDALDGQWGVTVEPSFSLSALPRTPEFRIGAGVGLAWISADIDNEFIAGQLDLFLITPELLLSWRQPVAEAWYVEPGVGVGAVIGAVDFVGVEWGSGYSVRPFVRIGYQADNWSAGVEVSYRLGHLDLGNSDGDIENLTAALFVAAKL
jgi:hypothetical protein